MADDKPKMMTVRIAYSPNKYEVGKIREVPVDVAKVMIREGRAARVYPGDIRDAEQQDGSTRQDGKATHTGPPPATDAEATAAGPGDTTVDGGSRTGRRRVTTTSTPAPTAVPHGDL